MNETTGNTENNEEIVIGDDPFRISYMEYDTARYEEFLRIKIDILLSKLPLQATSQIRNIDIIRSPVKHFRQRCRFAVLPAVKSPICDGTVIAENAEDAESAESVGGVSCSTDATGATGAGTGAGAWAGAGADIGAANLGLDLTYSLWENGGPNVTVTSFPIASISIYNTMPILLKYIQGVHELRDDLRAINFLSTLSGEVIATLVYEKQIESGWEGKAREMLSTLESTIPDVKSLNFIGRSHGTCFIVNTNRVTEVLHLADSRSVSYVQIESAFSNPNGHVNEKALDWICSAVRHAAGYHNNKTDDSSKEDEDNKESNGGEGGKEVIDRSPSDLLELYCGNGNHTMGIAAFAKRVVAVELNKSLCLAAEENLLANYIKNVLVIPCDSEVFARRILKEKCYTRRDTGEVYDFKTVLVDPPRAGLDPTTLRLLAAYESVIYISCSPDSLARDLVQLSITHDVERFAVFDQFAYTPHLEMGVYLTLKGPKQ